MQDGQWSWGGSLSRTPMCSAGWSSGQLHEATLGLPCRSRRNRAGVLGHACQPGFSPALAWAGLCWGMGSGHLNSHDHDSQ